MKNKLTLQPFTLAAFVLAMLFTQAPHLLAQGSSLGSFTYQGRLLETNGPANGLFDFQFSIYSASAGPSQVGTTITSQFLPVTNGLLTVKLDFPEPNNFDGSDRWLEIAVKPGGVATNYFVLNPRQQITAAPYATKAREAANLSGPLPLAQLPAGVVTNNSSGVTLAGIFTGHGAGLSNVNASTLGGLSSTDFWKTTGNAGANPTNGAFLGTTDNLPLEFRVNGARALRLEPNTNGAPNVIGGSPANTVATWAEGATIAGGGLGLYPNTIVASYATIGGGTFNTVAGGWATIGGGRDNNVTGHHSTLSGGSLNTIHTNADYTTIGGGIVNTIQTNARFSTIGGGQQNTIRANANHATINGGNLNTIQTNANFATIGGGKVNQAAVDETTVAGGAFNSALAFSATIGGGGGNAASGEWSTIAGGRDNLLANANYATIGGGLLNLIQSNAFAATIPGGQQNAATDSYAFAAGRRAKAIHSGTFVWADATDADFTSTGANQFLIRAGGGVGINHNNPTGASLAVGGAVNVEGIISANALSAASVTTPEVLTPKFSTAGNVPLEVYVNNQRALRLEPTANPETVNVIGGSANNFVGASSVGATIGGGGGWDTYLGTCTNSVEGDFSTVSGGARNTIHVGSGLATIGGGYANTIQFNADQATIGGGFLNLIQFNSFSAFIGGGGRNEIWSQSESATIGGGSDNIIKPLATYATIGGGFLNTIQTNASRATIGGGDQNVVGGNYATVPGGVGNQAMGNFSFAAGHDARALHAGTFVWSDAPAGGFTSTSSNQFLIRASGGVGINQNNPATALDVNGTVTATGFSGSGAGLTGLNAANLTGSVPSAALTSIPAANLTGTIPDARLSSNVALRSGGNAFTGTQTITSGIVGIGTPNPQGTLHVYSVNNPTVMRIQSSGTPGFGRLEFVSNPQGDVNEWRPGYIQSTDNGGFVGGLAFFVNGAGAGNKFGSNEVMRVVNGAVGIGTATPVSALQVVGTVTATAFNPPSDRNLKENFAPVSSREVLEKVATLPISRWNFKGDAATPHVGPMAQDFHAAFGLGTDERHIATVDADGVALAAIQGLNRKLTEELTRRDTENAELKARLQRLEQLVNQQTQGNR